MDAQEDVLGEILRARSVGNRAGYQRKHQVLVLIDQFLKGARFVAAAAVDERALAFGLHQP